MFNQNQDLTVDVIEPSTDLSVWVDDARRQEFGRQLQRAALSSDAARRLEWEKMIDAWLDAKEQRCGSVHTRRAYEHALLAWREFLVTQFTADDQPVELWDVDHEHVRAWQRSMVDRGLEPTSVNHALAAVSSFYSFVIAEKRMVNGVEMDMFMDRLGRVRLNPFKAGNVRRERTRSYTRAKVLSVGEYDTLLRHLEAKATTKAGARNYALVLTYLHTGWRSEELLRMRWGEVRPSKLQPGTMVFAWRGKGGKTQDDVLPGDCWAAICKYLEKAGRLENMQPMDHVWLPVSRPEMKGIGITLAEGEPISGKTALGIVRRSLRAAGIPEAESFRVHDLRHTHAHLLLESGQNLAVVQGRLHHSSLATTGLYTAAIRRADPLDVHSSGFVQLRLGVG